MSGSGSSPSAGAAPSRSGPSSPSDTCGAPAMPSSASRGSMPRRAYRAFESGCSESVTVTNVAAPSAASMQRRSSSPPTPLPCASGSTNSDERNHQRPRWSALPQATSRPPDSAAPAARPVVPQDVQELGRLVVLVGHQLLPRAREVVVQRLAIDGERRDRRRRA